MGWGWDRIRIPAFLHRLDLSTPVGGVEPNAQGWPVRGLGRATEEGAQWDGIAQRWLGRYLASRLWKIQEGLMQITQTTRHRLGSFGLG